MEAWIEGSGWVDGNMLGSSQINAAEPDFLKNGATNETRYRWHVLAYDTSMQGGKISEWNEFVYAKSKSSKQIQKKQKYNKTKKPKREKSFPQAKFQPSKFSCKTDLECLITDGQSCLPKKIYLNTIEASVKTYPIQTTTMLEIQGNSENKCMFRIRGEKGHNAGLDGVCPFDTDVKWEAGSTVSQILTDLKNEMEKEGLNFSIVSCFSF